MTIIIISRRTIWILIFSCLILARNDKIKAPSPPLGLPTSSFTGHSGAVPSELFNQVSPSLLAAATASATQSGIPLSNIPFLSQPEIPSTINSIAREGGGQQGEVDKDTKLKEILSHIYQYVSRQYNQRLHEQMDATNGISPNGLPKVRILHNY